MTRVPAPAVRDAKPPALLIRVLNPVMRVVLRTPLGKAVAPFALLEFRGRRSGRLLRVPVGWHLIDGARVVATPAPWRVNFGEATPVTVYYRGRRHEMTAARDADAESIAATLQSLADSGKSLKQVGIIVAEGHRFTADDVRVVDRQLLRFS